MDLIYNGYEHYEDDFFINEEPRFVDYVLDQFNLYIDILNTIQVDQRKLTTKEIFINAINSLRWSTNVFDQMITKNIPQKDIIYLIKELSKKFCYKKGPYKILFGYHYNIKLIKDIKKDLIKLEQYGFVPSNYGLKHNKNLIPGKKNINYNIKYNPRLRPSLYWKLIEHINREAVQNNPTTVTTITTTKYKNLNKILKNSVDQDDNSEETFFNLMKINIKVVEFYKKIVNYYFNEKVINFDDFFTCEDILNKVQDKAELFCQFKAFLSESVFWDNLQRFTTKENLVKLINEILDVKKIFIKVSTEKEFKNIIDSFNSDELIILNTGEAFGIDYYSREGDTKIIKKVLLVMDKLSENMTKKEYKLYKQRYLYGEFGKIIKEHEQFGYRKFGQPNDIGVFEYEI